MTLTLSSVLQSAGVAAEQTLAIRHAFVSVHEDGSKGIRADSSESEILAYTANQLVAPISFPAVPPSLWVVFLREGGDRARLWSIVENHGEVTNDGHRRDFALRRSELLDDLRGRLVIRWPVPRKWQLRGATAGAYPVVEIADAEPIPFPGFDALTLDHPQLQAVIRDQRYASWRTALSSVLGVYLITDTRDGRVYVGKADGRESILQRWGEYATNGHGGNVELRGMDPASFRYSVLRVFDPATPEPEINAAESHYKRALDSRLHGLNRN